MTYQQMVRQRKSKEGVDPNRVEYLTETNIRKTAEGHVLDELGLDKMGDGIICSTEKMVNMCTAIFKTTSWKG